MSNDSGSHTAYDHDMRVWEAEKAAHNDLFGTHLSAMADFASLAIKSIILGNSASAGAVLAFLAAMWGKPEARTVAGPALHSVKIFAVGIFAAMCCAAACYIAQTFYGYGDLASEQARRKVIFNWFGVGTHVIAILLAAAGMASFAVGVLKGLAALGSANGGAPIS